MCHPRNRTEVIVTGKDAFSYVVSSNDAVNGRGTDQSLVISITMLLRSTRAVAIAVLDDENARDGIFRIFQNLDRFVTSTTTVPESDGGIVRSRKEQFGIVSDRNGVNSTVVTLESSLRLSRNDVRLCYCEII